MAGALGACSSDVARFSDNPFGNPFRASGSGVDRTATGSVVRPVQRGDSQPETNVALGARSVGRVTARPLAAPMVTGSVPSASRAPSAVDLASTASTVSTTRAPAGWSAEGGTQVVVAEGETAQTLSSRYGVPASAILAANGLGGGARLAPGSRITIPVYNAAGAPAAAAAQPAAQPVAAVPAIPSAAAPMMQRPAPVRAPTPPAAAAATARPAAPPPRVAAAAPPRQAPVTRAEPRVAAAAPPRQAPVTRAEPRVAASAPPRQAPVIRAEPRVAAAAPPRQAPVTRAEPPAPVAAPKPVASASADAARERARAQAEASRARAEVVRQQDAVSARADAEAATRRAAEAKASADAEKARLAEIRARTDAERVKAAEARKTAESERVKAAEAKAKAETERRMQADAKLKAERTARQQAAVPRAAADPAPTASIAKDEPKAAPTADFRWPARGRVITGFTGKGANEGINIAVPEGTPVKAAGDGVVAYSGNELKGYGNLVLIRHDNGYVSAYAHNGDLNVKRGEKVNRGQVIARSGQTGNVSTPQLHFEIRKGSNPVDPMPYLNN
jgi:murein DD-endopeptidase MepM/ murein hydrolase activator NlpD